MDRQQARTLEAAADWADRFDDLSDAERRAFTAWIEEAAEHAQAFSRMRRLMTDSALFDALGPVEPPAARPVPPLPDVYRRHSRPSRMHAVAPPLGRRQAIAAGLIGALAAPLAGYWLLRQGNDAPQPAAPLRFASAVGERRRLVLSDGSGVLLDAASAVSVHFTRDRRVIALEQGAARFDVRHDARRPFEVRTPLANMVALGTSFTVDHLSGASELKVFSGKVRLDVGTGAPMVFPGGQWALVNGASVRTGAFDPAARGDWQHDWLDADSMRLGFAVERLARYSATPLKLGDPELADLTFSGRFRLDQPVESLELIGALFGLRAESRGGIVYLARAGRG